MGAAKQSGEPRVDIVAFQRLVQGQGREGKVLGLRVLGVYISLLFRDQRSGYGLCLGDQLDGGTI